MTNPNQAVIEHRPHWGRYLWVWLALGTLTAATFISSRFQLGPLALPVALGIATAKSTLVVLYFMHLSEQPGSSRLFFVTSIFFVLLLLAFALGDVATRFPFANPPHGYLDVAPPSAR